MPEAKTGDVLSYLRLQLSGSADAPQLEAAAGLVADQIAMFDPPALLAGRVVMILLANPHKVMTTVFHPINGRILQVLETGASAMLQVCSQWTMQDTLYSIHQLAGKHGVLPGAQMPQTDMHLMGTMIATLFAPLTRKERREIAARTKAMFKDRTTPVLIGLTGPGKEAAPDTYSGAWPIILPLETHKVTIN